MRADLTQIDEHLRLVKDTGWIIHVRLWCVKVWMCAQQLRD